MSESYKRIIDLLGSVHMSGDFARAGGMDEQLPLKRIALTLARELPDVFMAIHDSVQGEVQEKAAPIDREIIACLAGGNKVGAIKRRRELTGEGLKDSKDWCDALQDRHTRTGRWEDPNKPTVVPATSLGELLRQRLSTPPKIETPTDGVW